MKTIKSKITLGVMFLFVVILLLSILGILFINRLARQSKGTIVDNYSSVDYTMNMIYALDNMYSFDIRNLKEGTVADSAGINKYMESKNSFEKNLRLESGNITEKGEGELAGELRKLYDEFLNSGNLLKSKNTAEKNTIEGFNGIYRSIKLKIFDIYSVNMSAINYKSNIMQSSADSATFYMVLLAAFSILVALFFIFTFPSKIVKPIKELTEKIKSISERNYDQKLEVTTKDELGELSNAFNTMAEKLRVYEAKQIDRLLFEQKRLEAVVRNFEDGIFLIDENRKVVLVNDTLLQITGLKEQEILHHYISDVAGRNDLIKEIYATLRTKLANGNTEIKPIRIAGNGKESFFNIESEEIITYSESEKKETFIGNLVLLKNITKFQERDAAKTNLLATVSHELKTPLSSINISLKLLEDPRVGDLNQEQKNMVVSIKQQGIRLAKVINELLDYAQAETGNIRLTFAEIKPDEIVELAVINMMMFISEKNIQLDTKADDNLPAVRADIEKTVWVLVNILNNAIRYSAQGGKIIINAQLEGSMVRFAVRDFGPGISEEDCAKIFNKFVKVGQRFSKGTGLGLAISKDFVQSMGGRIWVESKPGAGSTFSFTVPAV